MLYALNISHFCCLTPHTMLLHITLLSCKAAILHWPELLQSTSHSPIQYPVSYNNNSRINWPNTHLHCLTNNQPRKYSRGRLLAHMYWYYSFPHQDFTAEWALEVYFQTFTFSLELWPASWNWSNLLEVFCSNISRNLRWLKKRCMINFFYKRH